MRIGIVTSHPIQYQAPLFRALANRTDLKVYFAHRATPTNQAEAGFGLGFDWDVDLTGGYSHAFLDNIARHPGINSFKGCDTPEIETVLARDKIEAVIIFGWHFKTYLQAAKAARKLGIPSFVRTDSTLLGPRSLPVRTVKRAFYPFFLRRFDGFLPTGSLAVEYLRHYTIPQSRIWVVPYCVDVDAFASASSVARTQRQAIRKKWGIGPGDFTALFVGKFIALKRIADLLHALRILKQRSVSVSAILVGSGSLENELRRQAAELGVTAIFPGFINQSRMPELYAAGDVLVLPSQSETWGLAVNEAFACGVPAIVSDRVGCAPDMIKDGFTGKIFALGDRIGLAQAIEGFLGRVESPPVLAALNEMSECYSPGRSADTLVTAVTELTGPVAQRQAASNGQGI